MDVLTVILLSFCVFHCYGRSTQSELVGLRLDVDTLRTLAIRLKIDIDGLKSWRNATFASQYDTSGIDSNNECVDSRSLGGFEQTVDTMERRVSYIMNGLEGEKKIIRDIDGKLNQHILSTESKVSEINEQSNKLEKSINEVLEQLNDISARLDTTTKANGDILEQVTHPAKQTSTTVQDTTVSMKHRSEQYYVGMKQEGWLQYNNSLYKLFTRRADFSTAVKSCEDNGASLAEITDMAELQFIAENLASDIVWLGASDLRTEGEWRWLSGQLVTDGNWYPGQPDNNGGGQDCLMTGRVYQYKYRDYWCSGRATYVCKLQ